MWLSQQFHKCPIRNLFYIVIQTISCEWIEKVAASGDLRWPTQNELHSSPIQYSYFAEAETLAAFWTCAQLICLTIKFS